MQGVERKKDGRRKYLNGGVMSTVACARVEAVVIKLLERGRPEMSS
jgi:hypothetical protein